MKKNKRVSSVFVDKKKNKLLTNRTGRRKKEEVIDEKVFVDEVKIKDSEGNIEKHDIVTELDKCDFLMGDFDPDDKSCMVCSSALLCCVNAVIFGRIAREQVPEKYKPIVESSLDSSGVVMDGFRIKDKLDKVLEDENIKSHVKSNTVDDNKENEDKKTKDKKNNIIKIKPVKRKR